MPGFAQSRPCIPAAIKGHVELITSDLTQPESLEPFLKGAEVQRCFILPALFIQKAGYSSFMTSMFREHGISSPLLLPMASGVLSMYLPILPSAAIHPEIMCLMKPLPIIPI